MTTHVSSSQGVLASLILTTIALAGMPSVATAELLAYDPFNMASGGSIAGTSSTSPGVWPTARRTWSATGGSVDVSAGSLSLPAGVVGLPTDGNRAVLGNTGGQVSAARSLGTTYSSASTLWFSYLFTQSNTNNADGNNDGISLFGNGTERIFFGSDGAGDFVIRAISGQSVTGTVGDSSSDAFANTSVGATSSQTFQLVVNIDPSTGYTMWVNPTGFNSVNGVPTGGTSASVTSNLLQFSFDTIQLGGDDPINTNGSVTFDEFRFGTTAAAVVPEPSTYAMALAGLACGGWQMFRRRRLRQSVTVAA